MPFEVLSPDGFTIHPTKVWETREEAIEAAKEWVQSYARQGFYRTNEWIRIPLSELLDKCEVHETPFGEDYMEKDLVGEENPQF